MNKKLKTLPTSLELVKDLKSFVFKFDQKSAVDCLYVSGALDIIQKSLEALETIKEKRVNVLCLVRVGLEKYNNEFVKNKKWHLTPQEYDLLKEVLSWELKE